MAFHQSMLRHKD
jgi:hypothetical protein